MKLRIRHPRQIINRGNAWHAENVRALGIDRQNVRIKTGFLCNWRPLTLTASSAANSAMDFGLSKAGKVRFQ